MALVLSKLYQALRLAGATVSPVVTRNRNFLTFPAASAASVELKSAITLSGDFEIEIDQSKSVDTGATALFGSSGSFLRLGGDSYQYMINSNYVSTGVTGTVDGTLTTVCFKRIGSTVSISENDTVIDSRTASTDDFVIEHIASRGSSGNHFNGILANFKVWAGGDRSTGTLLADFPLKETLEEGNVAENESTILGTEVCSDTSFDNPSDWTSVSVGWTVSDGSATCNGSPNAILGQVSTADLNNGSTYLVEYEVSGRTQGSVRVLLYANGQVGLGGNTSSNGKKVELVTISNSTSTTSDELRIQNIAGGFDGSINNLSVKEVPATNPYGLILNMTELDSQYFEWLPEASSYISEELDTGQLATFDNFLGGASITTDAINRSVTVDSVGTNAGYPRMFINVGAHVGGKYRVVGEVTGDTTPGIAVRFATSGSSALIATNVGAYDTTVIAEAAGVQVLVDGTKLDTTRVVSNSVKRILETQDT